MSRRPPRSTRTDPLVPYTTRFRSVAAASARTLVALARQRNVAYLYTPAEVLGGTAGEGVASGEAKFRLGGMVAEHSFKRATGSMQVQFAVTDGDAQMPVVYTGILPDLFRENQAVIATGHMRGDTFRTETRRGG